jgi:hypothetical protein
MNSGHLPELMVCNTSIYDSSAVSLVSYSIPTQSAAVDRNKNMCAFGCIKFYLHNYRTAHLSTSCPALELILPATLPVYSKSWIQTITLT